LVYEKVKSFDEMVALGLDDKGRERFTTQEMLALESRMIERSMELAETKTHVVGEALQLKALSQKSLTLEQKIAFDHIVDEGGLKCMVGFAGTGKSYLLGAARDAWESKGYSVHGVTLSGIASQNLEGSSGIASRTFASRCHYWDKGEQSLTSKDILVVDEAGMLSSRQMTRLMDEAQAGGAKVVLVGDPQQLQAIEAGAAFRAISERTHYVELTDIRRQREEWQREATKEFALGKTADAIDRYAKHSHLHDFETSAYAKTALVEVWNDARLAQPEKTQIMLAYNRNDVLELNQSARALRHAQGELGKDVAMMTERGERSFAEHDRVYFLKNDKSLGVMNGTLGTIEATKDNTLTIRLDKDSHKVNDLGRKVSVTMEHYNHLDYGYAATIHKAQGVTVDRSYVLASKFLDSHSSYVAMSRHRESADLFYGRDVFLTKNDLVKTLGRDRAKDVTLDYLNDRSIQKEFAAHRGVGLNDENVSHATQENSLDRNKTRSREDERLMRQEKLMEFSKAAKMARESRDMGRDRSSKEPTGRQLNDELSDFKRQFELKNPERAAQLRYEISPAHEKKALSLINEFKHLEQIVEKGGRSSSLAQDHLEKLADKMSKQKDVMEYVREHHEPISKQVSQLAKEFQRERDLGLER
jgi:Ti-type conjugative transfer relaxase TraA